MHFWVYVARRKSLPLFFSCSYNFPRPPTNILGLPFFAVVDAVVVVVLVVVAMVDPTKLNIITVNVIFKIGML